MRTSKEPKLLYEKENVFIRTTAGIDVSFSQQLGCQLNQFFAMSAEKLRLVNKINAF